MVRPIPALAAILIALSAAACTPREEPAPYAPPVAAEPVHRGKL